MSESTKNFQSGVLPNLNRNESENSVVLLNCQSSLRLVDPSTEAMKTVGSTAGGFISERTGVFVAASPVNNTHNHKSTTSSDNSSSPSLNWGKGEHVESSSGTCSSGISPPHELRNDRELILSGQAHDSSVKDQLQNPELESIFSHFEKIGSIITVDHVDGSIVIKNASDLVKVASLACVDSNCNVTFNTKAAQEILAASSSNFSRQNTEQVGQSQPGSPAINNNSGVSLQLRGVPSVKFVQSCVPDKLEDRTFSSTSKQESYCISSHKATIAFTENSSQLPSTEIAANSTPAKELSTKSFTQRLSDQSKSNAGSVPLITKADPRVNSPAEAMETDEAGLHSPKLHETASSGQSKGILCLDNFSQQTSFDVQPHYRDDTDNVRNSPNLVRIVVSSGSHTDPSFENRPRHQPPSSASGSSKATILSNYMKSSSVSSVNTVSSAANIHDVSFSAAIAGTKGKNVDFSGTILGENKQICGLYHHAMILGNHISRQKDQPSNYRKTCGGSGHFFGSIPASSQHHHPSNISNIPSNINSTDNTPNHHLNNITNTSIAPNHHSINHSSPTAPHHNSVKFTVPLCKPIAAKALTKPTKQPSFPHLSCQEKKPHSTPNPMPSSHTEGLPLIGGRGPSESGATVLLTQVKDTLSFQSTPSTNSFTACDRERIKPIHAKGDSDATTCESSKIVNRAGLITNTKSPEIGSLHVVSMAAFPVDTAEVTLNESGSLHRGLCEVDDQMEEEASVEVETRKSDSNCHAATSTTVVESPSSSNSLRIVNVAQAARQGSIKQTDLCGREMLNPKHSISTTTASSDKANRTMSLTSSESSTTSSDEGASSLSSSSSFSSVVSSAASISVTNTSSSSSTSSLTTSSPSDTVLGDTGRRLRIRNQRRFLPEKTRHKRQALQDMTRPLKQWLYKHRENPYPTKTEKMELVSSSQMSLTQVSNWFANARRRLKNTVRGDDVSWAKRVKEYNLYAEGNAELFSIPSSDEDDDDDDWDSVLEIVNENLEQRLASGTALCQSISPSPAPTLTSSLSDTGLVSPTTAQSTMTSPSPTTRSSPALDDHHGSYHKYKHSILQRYLHDASQQALMPDDELLTSKSRHRHLSSSTGSHDFEYLSTSSVSSPSHEMHHDSFDEAEEFEILANKRRKSDISQTSGSDDMYWKEIGAALALTSLAQSHINK